MRPAAPYCRRRAGYEGLASVALLVALAAQSPSSGSADGAVTPGATRADEKAWLDDSGTAVLGFGLLRVAPTKPGVPGSISLRYEEKPTDYAAFDSVQLMVLAADAFAVDGRAFADRTLAFSRSANGSYAVEATVTVSAPALYVVGYGPFVGPDTGRPLTLARAYTLELTKSDGVSRTWIDAEAGELQVKGWTGRPEVKRGGPVADPVTKRDHWFEVRPEIVYDRDRLKAPEDPETPETAARRREADTLRSRAKDLLAKGQRDAANDLTREADDVLAMVEASDDRIPVPAALAARMRRLPFRWK